MITKVENMIRQIQSIIGSSEYNELIKGKINFINSEFDGAVSIILIDSKQALDSEKVFKRAKVVWNNENIEFPKTPSSIMIDCMNLKGLDFLFAFLHECGHIKDYNNFNVKLRTKESEVSAWRHVYEDLIPIDNFCVIKHYFLNAVQTALKTYKLNISCTRDLFDKDI